MLVVERETFPEPEIDIATPPLTRYFREPRLMVSTSNPKVKSKEPLGSLPPGTWGETKLQKTRLQFEVLVNHPNGFGDDTYGYNNIAEPYGDNPKVDICYETGQNGEPAKVFLRSKER